MIRNNTVLFFLLVMSLNSFSMHVQERGNCFTITNPADQVANIIDFNGKSRDEMSQEARAGIVPSMFKYSTFLFKQNNIKDGIFWYCAGCIRTRQDIACSTDKSVEAAIGNIQFQMLQFLDNDEVKKIHHDQFKSAFAYIVQMTEERTLPSPAWVEEHGMSKILEHFNGEKKNTLLPESKWKSRRLEVLQSYRETCLAQK